MATREAEQTLMGLKKLELWACQGEGPWPHLRLPAVVPEKVRLGVRESWKQLCGQQDWNQLRIRSAHSNCLPEAKVNVPWRKTALPRNSIIFYVIIQWYLPLYISPTLTFQIPLVQCGKGMKSQKLWPLGLFLYLQVYLALKFCFHLWN